MSSEWLSVSDNDAVAPWSISVDGFFRKSVEKRMLVDNMTEVVKYGVMTTPAIVVDEKVVHIGSVPKEDELKKWL